MLRQSGVIVIPKAVKLEHVRENAASTDVSLTSDDLRRLEKKFPPPNEKQPLASY